MVAYLALNRRNGCDRKSHVTI